MIRTTKSAEEAAGKAVKGRPTLPRRKAEVDTVTLEEDGTVTSRTKKRGQEDKPRQFAYIDVFREDVSYSSRVFWHMFAGFLGSLLLAVVACLGLLANPGATLIAAAIMWTAWMCSTPWICNLIDRLHNLDKNMPFGLAGREGLMVCGTVLGILIATPALALLFLAF